MARKSGQSSTFDQKAVELGLSRSPLWVEALRHAGTSALALDNGLLSLRLELLE